MHCLRRDYSLACLKNVPVFIICFCASPVLLVRRASPSGSMMEFALVTWESTALVSIMLVVLGCVVLILGDQLCTPDDRKVSTRCTTRVQALSHNRYVRVVVPGEEGGG